MTQHLLFLCEYAMKASLIKLKAVEIGRRIGRIWTGRCFGMASLFIIETAVKFGVSRRF